jgi:hypothetical protein
MLFIDAGKPVVSNLQPRNKFCLPFSLVSVYTVSVNKLKNQQKLQNKKG